MLNVEFKYAIERIGNEFFLAVKILKICKADDKKKYPSYKLTIILLRPT